ncbi:MAG: hypothetical protein IPN90_03125 [Elusimicrobia bacterium]|nr:hypothetical protein [Elusimicrobiota bacterium]
MAKTILPEALRQAWERSRELVFMGENLDTYLSVLQTTIQEFKRLGRDSPLGTAIFNEEARTQWEAMIELLQDQLLETLQTSFPSEVLPDQMKKFSEDLGFSEDQRKFLHFYSILYSPGRALSVRSLQSYWEGKTGREILDLQRSLLDKLGDADALPLEADEQVESPKDKIDFGPSGELTVNGYPVFLPPNYEPKGYSGGFSKDAKIERAIVVAIRTLSSHPETIFATRKGMGALGIHKSKPLSHTIFIKFVGQKAFVLWVGPFSDSHGVGIAPDTVVDQGVIQRAQELNKTTEGSVPLMLKHYRPNGEGEGSKLNFSFLGTSQTIAPMIFLFPILFVLAWSHAPLWTVVVAVIFVVGLGNVELGKFIRQSWKNVKKSPKLFFERVKSDPGEGKTSTSNLAKELAEVMIFADKGNSPGASERVIALLNGTPSRLNVESIVGPQGLGALAAVTESAVFRDSGFQNQFLLEMGRVFPKGFPLGLARRAVGHLALDSTTRVGAQGIAADADMKTKKGLMVVVTREMLKDLPNRVGSFEKAAQGKPVYWVAEDALVFQALQKVRPSANLLIRPRWVEREGTVVVVSGKALERFVNSTRFLQDFAIALPRGAQVDMDGIAAASVLRNAVFFFLDELLSGMKVDFNTLRTIDTVARRIASAA